MKKIEEMIQEANEAVEVISAEDAIAMQGEEDVTFIDIRELSERNEEGTIPGSNHVPRGMLEFWVNPESPSYKVELFPPGNKYYFY